MKDQVECLCYNSPVHKATIVQKKMKDHLHVMDLFTTTLLTTYKATIVQCIS